MEDNKSSSHTLLLLYSGLGILTLMCIYTALIEQQAETPRYQSSSAL